MASLINDLVTLWPDGRRAVSSQELVDLLTLHRPMVYAGLDVMGLGHAMRSLGVYTRNVRCGNSVRRGIVRTALPPGPMTPEDDDPTLTISALVPDRRPHPPAVYFVERYGFLKIGTTTDLWRRVDALNKGDSMIPGMINVPVRPMAVMPGNRKVEYALHALFRELRYEAEWFLFEEPLLSFVKVIAEIRYDPYRNQPDWQVRQPAALTRQLREKREQTR